MHEPNPLVSSKQDTVALPSWVEHSRESLSGAAVRSSIRARLFPQISTPTPQRVGRFAILSKIGRGGMGVVYAAYDERLDRKVALKLVRSSFTANGDELLTLEAQGLAKLSHPHVVQVHEVGEHEGELFIAMEFIAGQTLRLWSETPRAWTEILATLIQAGRGLEAAHAAGLVHRDFKPDNVLVGDDGRARVLDFGLARTVDLVEHSEDLPDTLESNESATQTLNPRKLAGTPNYMAPELFAGDPAGPKADQWAFCVVAYEALFELRPFSGASLWDLASAVIEDQPAPFQGRTEVPARVREIIMRGLSKSASDRWPSMTELLAALDMATERRSTVRGLSIALLLGGGLALLGAALVSDPRPEQCPLDRAALDGTWDADRRVELEQRYAASELPYADAAASVLVDRLDHWAKAHVQARRDTCVATTISGTQSEALLDARIACFDRQRAEVEGLLALVRERPAATVVAGTQALVEAVPQTAACQGTLDPEALPEDPEQVAAIHGAYRRLNRANGLLILGELGDARRELEALAKDSAVHGHAPLELELRLRTAELEFHAGRWRASLDALHGAALDARTLGLRELETQILVRAATVSAEAGALALTPWVIREAEQALASRNRPFDPQHARVQWARGRLAERSGDLDEARDHFDRALANGREFGEPFASERVLLDIGNVEAERGELDSAKQSYERALERERKRWGPRSPAVGRIERALGALALERGELEQAEARFDAAALIFTADGPMAPALALVADGRAKLAFHRGDLEQARRFIVQGLAILQNNDELETEAGCNLTIALGVVRYFEGDFEGSKAAYERALPLIRRVYGDTHSLVGLTRSNLGESLLALGQLDRARAEFIAALAVLEPAISPEDPRLALPLAGLGLCDLEEGEHALAAHRLERALGLVDGVAEPQERAKIQFGLARALAGSGRDLQRARELASAAALEYERLQLHDQHAAVVAWLR